MYYDDNKTVLSENIIREKIQEARRKDMYTSATMRALEYPKEAGVATTYLNLRDLRICTKWDDHKYNLWFEIPIFQVKTPLVIDELKKHEYSELDRELREELVDEGLESWDDYPDRSELILKRWKKIKSYLIQYPQIKNTIVIEESKQEQNMRIQKALHIAKNHSREFAVKSPLLIQL